MVRNFLTYLLLFLFFTYPALGVDNYISQVLLGDVPVNMKVTGTTNLFITENGTRNFHVTGINLEANAISSLVTSGTLNIGTNSPSCNNIWSATSLSSLITAGLSSTQPISSALATIPANTTVCANVSIGAIGTTQIINVGLFGYYE